MIDRWLAAATESTATWGPDKSLTTLLSTEGLLFAVFALTLSFGNSSLILGVSADLGRKLAAAIAAVLTVLGIGAVTAWTELFVCSTWPSGFGEWFPVLAIVVAAVAQPMFAWVFVVRVRKKPSDDID